MNPANGTYELPGMGHRNHGSLDYKGTDYEHFKKLQIHAVGGPTYDPLPPFEFVFLIIFKKIIKKMFFSWRTTDIIAKHYGQPDLWKFEPFITEWENEVLVDMTPVYLKFD